MTKQMKHILTWVAVALAMMIVYNASLNLNPKASPMDYSDFVKKVQKEEVVRAVVDDKKRMINATLKDGKQVEVIMIEDPFLSNDLIKKVATVKGKKEEESSTLWTIFINFGPMILMLVVWVWIMKKQMGGGKSGGPFSFGKNRARLMDEKDNKITFADVAGCDEAKQEVTELVDFLRDPSKFTKLGGKIPKGVLMVGSPGTGKTLLARAIAGEAKVPFYAISGSDFVEMFVGVGAARVRDMFEEAKKNAPCIIFIDEIDAVGRKRGTGMGGGNDEREQTLNQMLVEMDGFEENAGIIVIAATNRPDVLDPALLRPGRFDRQVNVSLPDIRGREQILQVHLRKIPMGADVKVKTLAGGTPGFSGAELANLVNEAALFAARRSARFVEMQDFLSARDKLVMGAERNSAIMPEKELRNTAYHESGHAIVSRLLPNTPPVHKVTIIPRGRALGVTMYLSEEDRYSHDKEGLLNEISILLAGRIAEEIFMGQMTTGASNDFQRATAMVRKMVCEWGMSDLGVMVFADTQHSYLGGESSMSSIAEKTKEAIDAEIKKILQQQYNKARQLLEDNRDLVEVMTKALLEIETIDADQVDDIMNHRDIRDYDQGLEMAQDRRKKVMDQKEALSWKTREV